MSRVQQATEQISARFTAVEGQVSEQQTAVIKVDLTAFLNLPPEAVPVVFYTALTLEEDDFEYELPDPRSGMERVRGEPFEAVTVGLEDMNPKLKRFRKHLGQPRCVWFTAPYNGVLISCFELEDWYEKFFDEAALAEEQARLQAQEVRAAEQESKVADLERHIQRLRLFLDDTGFLRLARLKSTAQRTLISYAKQREPQAVAALGEARLKELMGELRDWVLVQQGQ